MEKLNEFKLSVPAKSINESFCRAVTAAFSSLCDPTVEEISDIKTAVSEAVTNCIVHAYREKGGPIYIDAALLKNNTVKIRIRDKGCGIENIEKARQPLYTSLGDERSGLGFTVMESFCDEVKIRSALNKGTVVTLTKRLSSK